MRHPSWGNYPQVDQQVRPLVWRQEPLPRPETAAGLLPRGLGRSYGDSCLNDGGTLLDTTPLNHFIEFDRESGVLRCEAGVSLEAILETCVPLGWFLPVSPGTKFVTVGGAIANDIHGKNHHRAGTFGCHVEGFELLRSDGRRLFCSEHENRPWYAATIGGLGLTGLITWAEIRLRPIASPMIDQESVRFGNLDEFFDLARESDSSFEYTVAWIDCLARGSSLGRGIFLRGNHSDQPAPLTAAGGRSTRTIPLFAPGFLLNRYSIRAFNQLYYNRQRRRIVSRSLHFDPFFYPLDSIGHWNRLYGRRGFLQYQYVVPVEGAREATREILARIAASDEGSFLSVLKVFGDLPSPGILSFPRPGTTLALDFANRGRPTLQLLEELDEIVRRCGGRVYPAKDARMSPEAFRDYFSDYDRLSEFIDPAISSSFWRRVTGAGRPCLEKH